MLEDRKDVHKVRVLTITITLLLSLQLSVVSASNIADGINWLYSNQNQNGSWGINPEVAIVDTTEVLDTLKYLNISDSIYLNGVTWLTTQSPLQTDFLSRKIISLYMAGIDVSTDISTLINTGNADSGWGGDRNSQSTVVDTALALQSLKAINYSD